MDMRKLIDDTDFDNLNQISKRWKKEGSPGSLAESKASSSHQTTERPCKHRQSTTQPTLKENQQETSNMDSPQKEVKELAVAPEGKRKREVMPQVIDEDTEHFRNRLQHLLNTFKTDAVSEFMGMKKSMIEYQKDTIKNDTQKYLSMYEEKHQELLQAKEQLITLSHDHERKSMQIELMSNHIAQLNHRLKATRLLARPFSMLLRNKEEEKMERVKMAEAQKHDRRRLKMKTVNGWRNLYREAQKERQAEVNNNKVEQEVTEIVNRYQKEMEMLKEKLAEATRKNEEYENSKQLIQENLKKAFLRGISSMNMEAMGIFGNVDQHQSKEENLLGNMSCLDPHQAHSLAESRTSPNLNKTAVVHTQPTVISHKPKVESKDHKWKEAPILGMEEKSEHEEPRTHVVKPTSEAKVIRVVDGKSNVELTPRKTATNTSFKTERGRGR